MCHLDNTTKDRKGKHLNYKRKNQDDSTLD